MEKSVKEIVAEAERLDIKDKGVLALSEVLFDKNMLNQIPKYRALFLRVSFFVGNLINNCYLKELTVTILFPILLPSNLALATPLIPSCLKI